VWEHFGFLCQPKATKILRIAHVRAGTLTTPRLAERCRGGSVGYLPRVVSRRWQVGGSSFETHLILSPHTLHLTAKHTRRPSEVIDP
jgi:hypothetical protein